TFLRLQVFAQIEFADGAKQRVALLLQVNQERIAHVRHRVGHARHYQRQGDDRQQENGQKNQKHNTHDSSPFPSLSAARTRSRSSSVTSTFVVPAFVERLMKPYRKTAPSRITRTGSSQTSRWMPRRGGLSNTQSP